MFSVSDLSEFEAACAEVTSLVQSTSRGVSMKRPALALLVTEDLAAVVAEFAGG